MLILLLFIHLSYALNRTNRFLLYRNESKLNDLYDSRTFGYNIHSYPSFIMNENSLFRSFINDRIKCYGNLCNENKFECDRSGDTQCYHVDHIINMDGPEFQNCNFCKGVVGNLVMIDGIWNSANQALSKIDYYSAQNEKQEVYGKQRIEDAMSAISICCYNNLGISYQIVNDWRPTPIAVYRDIPSCQDIHLDIVDITKCICQNESSRVVNSLNYIDDYCSIGECSCESDSIKNYCCGCDCDMDVDYIQGSYVITQSLATECQDFTSLTIVMGVICMILLISFIFYWVKYNKISHVFNQSRLNLLRSSVVVEELPKKEPKIEEPTIIRIAEEEKREGENKIEPGEIEMEEIETDS